MMPLYIDYRPLHSFSHHRSIWGTGSGSGSSPRYMRGRNSVHFLGAGQVHGTRLRCHINACSVQ